MHIIESTGNIAAIAIETVAEILQTGCEPEPNVATLWQLCSKSFLLAFPVAKLSSFLLIYAFFADNFAHRTFCRANLLQSCHNTDGRDLPHAFRYPFKPQVWQHARGETPYFFGWAKKHWSFTCETSVSAARNRVLPWRGGSRWGSEKDIFYSSFALKSPEQHYPGTCETWINNSKLLISRG